MNEEERLRHNYLERVTRDAPPMDREAANARTAGALRSVFGSTPAVIERVEVIQVRRPDPSPVALRVGPGPEAHRSYTLASIMASLRACDVPPSKMADILHVLRGMR